MTDEARALRRVIDSLSERLDATEARLAEATRMLRETHADPYAQLPIGLVDCISAFLAAMDGSER